ncbi:alkaline phosphatase isozyme conversion aminopeptidase [Symmachiella macrocystis]|uniref:Alkaline phosphatase isozyme conversion aminopeptidase n=1 Tax=Symmachiella macrocystis TaxID=2527985 RepID=A0A5C6BQ92_9PLAN|nr:M28 family peptidase [Symmachiella macrocystis]TWU12794.1 alkaline phosphatase isozyme conversion aminopeptidase [Symmachiella macrocystis]
MNCAHWNCRATRIVAVIIAAILVGTFCAPVRAAEGAHPDAKRAFGYLAQICRIGPRISGSRGMMRQQQLIGKHFAAFDCEVKYQPFDVRHPLTGNPVRMNNIIISWNPQVKERVLLGCHYDTRPLPDRDRDANQRQQGVFLGANDGASGVALFMELAHHMKNLPATCGVDFVIFDGEELVYGNRGEYFLGSTYFAENYRDHPVEERYTAGVLVDMVADRNLRIYVEKNSLKYAPNVTKSIWKSAEQVGVDEFVPRAKHEVRDDHLPLNEIAKIPTCDIIDFDYPYWHTTRDVPNSCSGKSLAKVAKVLLHWLRTYPVAQPPAK